MTPQEMGRRGGRARMAALSPRERSALGRQAVQARWAKYKAEKGASRGHAQK